MKKMPKYLKTPDARIVDYCDRKIDGRPLGTSFFEGIAGLIGNVWMVRNQHMRWSTQRVHKLLQGRTAGINQRLQEGRKAA